MCVHDHNVVRTSLVAAKLGHMDAFKLCALISGIESSVGAHVYRRMSEDERHNRIIDAMEHSGDFSSSERSTPQILSGKCGNVGWNKADVATLEKLGIRP